MKYARSCTCSYVGRWVVRFRVFDPGLAADPDLALETDFALLLFRDFFVSVAGAGGVDGVDGVAAAVNVTAGAAATETGSVLFAFLRIARF